ncbi:hypothetical protein YC2023_076306 [Brassica napus]
MVLIFHSFKYEGFSYLDLDMQSSRRLPESLLMESSPISPFHNRSERFGKFFFIW